MKESVVNPGAVKALSDQITDTITPKIVSSLTDVKNHITAVAEDTPNHGIHAISIYCGFNSSPFISGSTYTGIVSKYNSSNYVANLHSDSGADVIAAYHDGTWNIYSLSDQIGNPKKVKVLTFTAATNNDGVAVVPTVTSYINTGTSYISIVSMECISTNNCVCLPFRGSGNAWKARIISDTGATVSSTELTFRFYYVEL
jgi:hypothetical protein